MAMVCLGMLLPGVEGYIAIYFYINQKSPEFGHVSRGFNRRIIAHTKPTFTLTAAALLHFAGTAQSCLSDDRNTLNAEVIAMPPSRSAIRLT